MTVDNNRLLIKLMHIHMDAYGGTCLDDAPRIKKLIGDCVKTTNSNLLHLKVHKFGGYGGVSAFAMIAESHISIHTWPELEFAALDFFTCGSSDGDAAIDEIQRVIKPKNLVITRYKRGGYYDEALGRKAVQRLRAKSNHTSNTI